MKELKIRYQVARWISRKIIGVATPEEEYCLEKWRVSDEVHRREYETIRKRLAKELREKSEVDIPAEWRKFKSRNGKFPVCGIMLRQHVLVWGWLSDFYIYTNHRMQR